MKKIVSAVLLVVTIFSSVIFAANSSVIFATNFSDLSESHWAYEPVMEMQQKGILNGYPDGTFLPNNSITRAEFAKILVLTLDLKDTNESMSFADVEESYWGYDYIKIASKYLSGYRSGSVVKFLPNEAAVREDVAVAVVIASNLENKDYDLSTLDRFSDKDQISTNLKKYVAIAVENNLMQGNADGTFNPKGKLTRAEVCKLMLNTVDELEKIAMADQMANKKCTKTETLPGHIVETTYTYKNSTKHKVYKKCKVCDVEIYVGDSDHDFTYADYCGYCDYYRKSSVSLSKTKATINVGESLELKATISSASNSKTKDLKWTSNNTSVATVNNGKVVAVGGGTAEITVETDNYEKATCTVTVKGAEVELKVTLYGDANCDGKVTAADSQAIAQYVEQGKDLSAQGLKNADVNLDGKVDGTDAAIIAGYGSGWVTALPAKDVIMYGDVNESGKLTIKDVTELEKYIAGKTKLGSDKARKNADFNGDGKVDATDVSSLKAYVEANHGDEKHVYPMPYPGETVKGVTIYGDVNGDGVANIKDASEILKYVKSGASLSAQGYKNADVDLDGEITELDALILLAIDSGYDIMLPAKNIVVYGDVDEDCHLTSEDVTKLENYVNGKTTLSTQAKKNADFNGDGKVDATDVLSLKAYIERNGETSPLFAPGETVELKATLYGDVNEDGVVSTKDLLRIEKYLANYDGTTLTEQGKLNADVYQDGKVDRSDAVIIGYYIAGWDVTLPTKDAILYGDVNEDGQLTTKDVTELEKYVAGKTKLGSEKARKNADFNGDGKVDATDVSSLKAYIESQSRFSNITPLIKPGETVKGVTIYGDVNGDGVVNIEDALAIQRHVENTGASLSAQGYKNADVDLDGKVTMQDAFIIQSIDCGWDITLPAKNIVAYGDVDEDHYLTSEDVEILENYVNGRTTLSTQAKKNADFNGDGKVDATDVSSLKAHIGNSEKAALIFEPGETVKLKATLYGDVNEDGVVDTVDFGKIAKYIETREELNITTQGLKNADVNEDGKVDGTDLKTLGAFLAGWDITLPTNDVIMYGDVNESGKLTSKDAAMLEEYLAGKIQLSAKAKKNADFNGDGKIDEIDVKSIKAYVEANHGDEKHIYPLEEPGETVK